MAIYKIVVEKFSATAQEYWTNVYHVNAEPGADSTPIVAAIVAAERAVLLPQFIVTKATVGAAIVGNQTPATTIVQNLAGTYNQPGDPMPLFVVARVDFSVAASAPSRKYLRGMLTEAVANFTTLDPAVIGLLATYAAAITAVPGICDVDGQAILGGAGKPAPGMRQLRKGSKKSATP